MIQGFTAYESPSISCQASPVHETKASYTEEDVRSQKRRTKLGSREFPRGDLLLTDYIGEGDYGPIYKGEAYGLGIKEQQRPVTVKMLTQQAPEATRIRFEQDIALLSSINHLNVVGMLAVCTEESPECILLDAGKDLHVFIREKKAALVEEQPSDSIQSLAQQSLELLKVADEICLGMAYLASQHFIHKDLALRNCIIGYDGVSKVALFGLGPKTHPHAYYKTQGNDLPIRWMAPETISTALFTTENDQWAFGVLMWELFTYGELPYANKTNEEVIKFVAKDFGRLPKPEKCIEDIYLVMSSCWELETGSRPTFLVLHENLFDLIGEIQQKL